MFDSPDGTRVVCAAEDLLDAGRTGDDTAAITGELALTDSLTFMLADLLVEGEIREDSFADKLLSVGVFVNEGFIELVYVATFIPLEFFATFWIV